MPVVIKTLGAAGNPSADYNSFEAWNAGEATDLPAAGDEHVLQVYDDWPSGLDFSGENLTNWVTGPGNGITIEPVPGNAHNGDINSGAFFKGTSTETMLTVSREYVTIRDMRWSYLGNNEGIWVPVNNVKLERLICVDLDAPATGGRTIQVLNVAANVDLISSLIVHGAARTRGCYRMRNPPASQRLINVIIVDLSGNGVFINLGSATATHLATMQDCVFDGARFAEVGNEWSIGFEGMNTCAFRDGMDFGIGNAGTNPILGVTDADYVDPQNNDYRPADGSLFIDAGLDTTVPTDIQNLPWITNDVGAYRYESSGDVDISFTGSIADITGTQDQPITPVDVSGEFSGTLTPFTFTSVGTALPAGLTISSAGVISGTPTAAGTTSGHIVRGEDTGANTADSNGFAIVIDPATVSVNPAALRHPQRIQQAVLSQAHKISAADIRHLQRIEQTALIVTEINTISPADIRQDQRLQQAILQQLHTLQPADIRQAQRLQNALVFIPGTPLFPNDIRQGQRIDAAVIDVKSVITPATIRHDQRIEEAILELTRTLQPADIRQNQRLQQATFAGFVVGGLSGRILAYVLLDGSIVVNPDFNQH